MDRRQLLKSSIGAVGILASSSALAQTLAAVCGRTPPQTEGPFYPVEDQLDKDNDLTYVKDRTQKALGEVIYIVGKVQDEQCNPVSGALVEIWQACASGRYNHPQDPNTAPLDPNFQYWGKAVTDPNGNYTFKTILPGAYPAAPGWMRPPHIHFKTIKLGYHELTSQLYFRDFAELNAKDRILRGVPAAERETVIVTLTQENPLEPGTRIGEFNITLSRVL